MDVAVAAVGLLAPLPAAALFQLLLSFRTFVPPAGAGDAGGRLRRGPDLPGADRARAHRHRDRTEPGAVQRVCIPKPVSPAERRPLSIPSVRDRIVQAAVKIVLEPVFEAHMLPCSFGFRPQRAAHDGLQVLIDESWRGRRWVVETDIANCFAAILVEKLMQAVEERVCDQSVLKLLRVILRAGVMADGQVRRSVTGTPQGGISPHCWPTSTFTGSTGHGMCASTGCWCVMPTTRR